MPSNKPELAQRQRLAQPQFSTRGLFFNVIFTLVERLAGPLGTTKVRQGPLAAKLSDLRSYPIVDFLSLLYAAADVLEPALGSVEKGFFECGAASVRSFSTSGVGTVIFGVLGKGDPKKLLAATDTAYRTVVNYGQRSFQIINDRSVELEFQGDMMPPAYHQGIFQTALESLGFVGEVQTVSLALDRCRYRCSWLPKVKGSVSARTT